MLGGGTQARPSFPGSDLERGRIREPQTAEVHLEHSVIHVSVSFMFSLCPVKLCWVDDSLTCAKGKQRKGLLDRALNGKKSTFEADVARAVWTGKTAARVKSEVLLREPVRFLGPAPGESSVHSDLTALRFALLWEVPFPTCSSPLPCLLPGCWGLSYPTLLLWLLSLRLLPSLGCPHLASESLTVQTPSLSIKPSFANPKHYCSPSGNCSSTVPY